jgi:hypothetical protein
MATMTEALDEIDAELQATSNVENLCHLLDEYVKASANLAMQQDAGDTDGETQAQLDVDDIRAAIAEVAAS